MRKQLEKKVECWWKGTNIKKDEPYELIEKISNKSGQRKKVNRIEKDEDWDGKVVLRRRLNKVSGWLGN